MQAQQSASPRVERSLDRRGMTALGLGHTMADMTQGALPAMLPFLIDQRGYSYAAASALVLAATVSSSIIQPIFGHFADRRSLSWLMPVGVLVGVAGIASVGVIESYPLVFLAIVLSGLGVAAFHPEGSRFANYVSGDKRASGMSLFSVGGNVGFALGPALVTPLVLAFGLPGTLWLIVPAGLVAVWLTRELPRLETFRPEVRAAAHDDVPQHEEWGAFSRLIGVIAARTFVYFGLLTFLPLYFVDELGTSESTGNTALTVLLVGGAVGTLIGGPLADRYGRRTVLIAPMAVLPLLIVALHVSSPGLATVIGFFVGALTVSTFSVTVVLGQEFLPGRIGMASGITLGLAIGLGGLGAALLGLVADKWGLDTTLDIVTVLPVVALVLALTLPKGGARPAPAATTETFA